MEINGTFVDLKEIQKAILQWKSQNSLNFDEIGVTSNGIFDFGDVKNKLLQWKTQKLSQLCPSNGPQLQNLLNLGPQELSALSACAVQYFTNTSYASCATALMALSTSALNVQPSGCYMGYCDFVRCLRRVNSINLVTQCTREARTGVNITLDSDNVRFYTNVTSCILAKTRCGPFNPITGEPQTPGYTASGVRVSNALQFSSTGELRVLAFSTSTPVKSSFCSTTSNLTQTSWLTNVC
ncbi:hypothetical protein RR46_05106 [Papilio xuthus]|uniref:Uncharacterized protein n=1 Tax=Papilio xuthus TaxID=66420 RepID=A0A194Q8N4_PAPXU|nr:hypothetical protein RR46_05106 [Papilio xuthus]